MEQGGHVSANKRIKIQEKKLLIITQSTSLSVPHAVVDLTDDAWLLVFSYLGTADRIRVARVCTRWRELARISWKSITRLSFAWVFYQGCSAVGRRAKLPEVCLQQCGTRLQCLDLSSMCYGDYVYRVTPRFLNLVGLHGASLQELNISRNCYLDNATLKTFAKKLPRLRSLCLTNCSNVDDDGLRSALKMLVFLKSLNVAANNKITGDFFSQAPQSLTEVLAGNCDSLTDESVRVLTERCPNLEAIDISMCRNLARLSIRHLAENCPKLKRLNQFCGFDYFGWDESTFVTLFKLPLLEELHVYRVHNVVTDQLFCELSRHCPRLTAISLGILRNDCDLMTDAAFSHLCPWLHLESIDLNCSNITDKGLILLSSTHPQLKTVGLMECRHITVKGVGQLVSDHPNLLRLELGGCPHVTDGVMPMLESSLQRRQHTLKPLVIWGLVFSKDPFIEFITPEKLEVFRKNTRCIVNGR